GVNYTLKDGGGNTIDGPIAGTGNALAFTTGNLTSSTTFNVFAEGPPIENNNFSLDFDGVNDYILSDVPSGFSYNSAYTVEAWVKAPLPGGAGGYPPIFNIGTNSLSDVEMYVQQETNDLVIVHNRSNGGTLSFSVFPDPPNNVLFHLAVVFDGTNVEVFYDGVSQGSSAFVAPVKTGSAVINIGYVQNTGFPAPKNFNGQLDDYRMWSVARSMSDIQTDMSTCLDGTETGLEAYYNFEGGSGTTATDIANGFDGTMINMDGNTVWVAGTYSCLIPSCDFELSQTVTIGVANGYNLSETESACQGESYTFPDGSSQTINSQVVYTSNLQTIGTSCDSIIETTVNVAPDYDLTETASVCSGENYTFPDGTTQQNITSQVVYTSNLQTVSTSCDSIIETTVNVNPTYDLTETDAVCAGQNYTFPDGSMQTINSQVVYTSNLFTVGTQCDSIIETTVDVITVDANTTLTGNTISADQVGADYQWVDCNNSNAPISGAIDRDYTPTGSGNFAVAVTIGNCTETSGCTSLIITGIREASVADVRIYPVPTRNLLNIISDQQIDEISVYTINGKLIRTFSQNTQTIDVSALANGMYLLVTQTKTGVSQSRFIKE
ncbi:MAG: T9SS type A sorting domain-containing protein, partial [Flavobacteriales bacterium]|nr:T9SS type A sorting domain-containing protein [Flavobacteriales bacterium]